MVIDGVNLERFITLKPQHNVKGELFMPQDIRASENQKWRTKMVKWIKDRICEPSSYAAVGVGVMGIGMIIGQPILIWVGVVGGAVGFILKEKGVL
jgi:hypothetical protein